MSLVKVSPPSLEREPEIPKTYMYWLSLGSTRISLKYIGRGLMVLMRFQLVPPSSER